MTSDIRERRVAVNGVELSVLEAGDAGNPLIILSHGFPESAYSWRHQLPVLAGAGYHVIAPDQRGYGSSSVPKEVTDYGIRQLTGDLVALVDDAGQQDAIFVGHDWGGWIVWETARLHTDRVRAVVGVSVPAVQWPAPPVQMMRAAFADNFFYILYFQQVGPPEAELGADPAETIRKTFWGASHQGFRMPTETRKMADTGFLTNMPEPPALPWSWFTEDDLQHYAQQFRQSGFFGPVSYYRNLDANYEVVKDIGLDAISMPSFFITGANDVVLMMDPGGLDRMKDSLPNYSGAAVIEGAGHWTQQEKPAEFNEALLGFLRQLD
jgi:pimeloyl-ACP methyl ester carboxylesterase